jgi:LysM repeat protein
MKSILQKKRKRPSRGPLHIFHAALPRRRKHRAATADASELDEVPHFGVTSALVVILALHLVAIGAIYLHNRMTSDDNYDAQTEAPLTPSTTPAENAGYEPYVITRGDTWEIIARKKNVDLAELKSANSTAELSAGKKIFLPPPRVKEEPSIIAALEPEPLIEDTIPLRPTSRPPIEVNQEIYNPLDPPAGVVLEPQGEAILIKPATRPGVVEDAPESFRAVVVEEAPPEPVSSKSHTIRSGDTLYAISRKYEVKVDALMRLNKITDPGAIQIGRVLQIP